MPETNKLAEAILGLSMRSWTETSQSTAGLTESEFLALNYLRDLETATVGEVQRGIKVQPAQMSRIVRHLLAEALISSAINREDRRRIDVAITEAGKAAHRRYRDAKLAPIIAAMERLTESEQSQFMALVEKMAGR